MVVGVDIQFYIWEALSERFLNIFREKPGQSNLTLLFIVLHPEVFLNFSHITGVQPQWGNIHFPL